MAWWARHDASFVNTSVNVAVVTVESITSRHTSPATCRQEPSGSCQCYAHPMDLFRIHELRNRLATASCSSATELGSDKKRASETDADSETRASLSL